MKLNTKYLVGCLSILFVVCLGLATVERAEGHGKPLGSKRKTLVSSTFDRCQDPSTTILKRRYKVTQTFSHYGNNNPYPPTRQAPIPVHEHVSYETRYVSVKKGHSEYSSSCDTEDCGWETVLDSELGTCLASDKECNDEYEEDPDWCQSNYDYSQSRTRIVHWSCKDVWKCVPVP